MCDLDLDEVTLTRRLAVREERSKGWRTRAVDHFTESLVNPATHPVDRVKHDTIDVLVWILLKYMEAACLPLMWKRDIQKAFRRVPIATSYHDLCWVVFLHEGVAWASQHLGMPFGSVSAVYAWHRVGGFILWLLVRILKIPCARYVDDFFGASAAGIKCTGGVAAFILTELLGLPCDSAKSVDFSELMVVLGIQINLSFAEKLVSMVVQESKARAWKNVILSILECELLDPGLAAKLAGKLSFAVTAAAGRVGRAYVKPLYAQAAAPLAYHRISIWLSFALVWWMAYLDVRPATQVSSTVSKRHVVGWCDAAGASRWLGAVVYANGLFFYARCITPGFIWDQLLEREDNQIGVQEMLGVLLLLESFSELLQGALLTLYIDNDGVLGSCIKGSSHSPEINLFVGRMWLGLAFFKIDVVFVRVESEANIADGPTRDDVKLLEALGAKQWQAKLPGWLQSLWTSIQADDLTMAPLLL